MKSQEKEISLLIRAILEALDGSAKEKKEVYQKIEAVLKKSGSANLFKELLEKLEKRYLKKTKAELLFAREQPPELIEKLKNKLKNMLGEDKEFEIKIDKKIIGGFRLKTDKILIKASIKDFLEAAE
jgi:F0F1-type ATP synthase delta subunit